jgi:carbon monoxide dehydrogenase subunit G
MSMKVEGTKHFDAPQAKVWEVLNDPSRMAKTMPGVKDFSIEDDRHWTAKVVIPLGLGGLKMSINFEKVEERAPDYARLNAKGTGVGAMLNMDTQFELSESGGGTEMKWEADVRLMGQVGSMGQRVLQPIVNQQVQNVLKSLDAQVGEAAGSSATSKESVPAAAGSSAAEAGIHPGSPETYSPEPTGPTHSANNES